MSKHLHGVFVTEEAVAANVRGENAGNTSLLKKAFWNEQLHTEVSAESIRYAIRNIWMELGLPMSRLNDGTLLNPHDHTQNIDDAVLGFMTTSGKGSGAKFHVGRWQSTPAISLKPYAGERTFNKGPNQTLFSAQKHTTAYQYSWTLTPESLGIRHYAWTKALLDALYNLNHVGGGHARFLYEFAPVTFVMRWTDDPVSRCNNCFVDEEGNLDAPILIKRMKAETIDPNELWVGGELAEHPEIIKLVPEAQRKYGTKKIITALLEQIKLDLSELKKRKPEIDLTEDAK